MARCDRERTSDARSFRNSGIQNCLTQEWVRFQDWGCSSPQLGIWRDDRVVISNRLRINPCHFYPLRRLPLQLTWSHKLHFLALGNWQFPITHYPLPIPRDMFVALHDSLLFLIWIVTVTELEGTLLRLCESLHLFGYTAEHFFVFVSLN